MFRARILWAFLILFAMPHAASADGAIGSVTAIKGFPTATGTGGNRPLKAGSELFEGDTVIASSGGNVQLTLDDGTRVVVGAASRLEIRAYLRRSATTASKISVKALRGTFRFISGKSRKSAYEIETANATVGIRGTGFDLKVRDRTLAAVLVGTIRLEGGNGQEVLASAGCEVAEAGRGGVGAKLFENQPKSDRLRRDFPFIMNQSSLRPQFRLPVENCRSSLRSGSTSGGSGGTNSTNNQGALPDEDGCGQDCR